VVTEPACVVRAFTLFLVDLAHGRTRACSPWEKQRIKSLTIECIYIERGTAIGSWPAQKKKKKKKKKLIG